MWLHASGFYPGFPATGTWKSELEHTLSPLRSFLSGYFTTAKKENKNKDCALSLFPTESATWAVFLVSLAIPCQAAAVSLARL